MSTAQNTTQLDGSSKSKPSLGLFARIRNYQGNAELIFDREEPIGVPTDLVMPRRRRRSILKSRNR